MDDGEDSGPVRGSGEFLRDMGYRDPKATRSQYLREVEIAVAVEDGRLTPAEAERIIAEGRAREL